MMVPWVDGTQQIAMTHGSGAGAKMLGTRLV